MRKPSKKSLTRLLDVTCSLIIRKKGYCVKCHKTDNLQCCHIFSRKNRSTRWDLLNLLCLCAGCHFWSHQNPILFTEFVREYLGEIKYQTLKSQANALRKWTTEEMQELLEALKGIR